MHSYDFNSAARRPAVAARLTHPVTASSGSVRRSHEALGRGNRPKFSPEPKSIPRNQSPTFGFIHLYIHLYHCFKSSNPWIILEIIAIHITNDPFTPENTILYPQDARSECPRHSGIQEPHAGVLQQDTGCAGLRAAVRSLTEILARVWSRHGAAASSESRR